ncbi:MULTISPECIES: Rv3235 family protein [unclassified Streptomyces]|uniref:Rv3235 family protein n=1 Tax=unclassified Streptomyces TaxID=2593676 RepID=UPI0036ECF10D
MNKVMTRAQQRPGTRPPSRRDSRRPGTTPPRTPSGGTTRTAADGARPGPSTGPGTRTAPVDNRPAAGPTSTARATGTGPTTRATSPAAHAPHPTGPDAPVVPAQTPRRPVSVPQPRPTDVFADLLLAVLSGQRPVHSMLRHTVGQAYDELAELAERGPLRTRGTRPVVRDIGYYVPRDGAVEAFARIGAGDQLRAMAFRLEQGRDRRWRCTAVELGAPCNNRRDD